MAILSMIPFLLQSLAIGCDEYYFHIRRGLPRWERIGHPLDTLSVLFCFACVLFVPYSDGALKVYIGLAIVSCLMITKDEFVHKHHCPAAEQWLHALLFINHPILLTTMGLLWANGALYSFLVSQGLLTAGFCLYQIIYWNFVWEEDVATLALQTKIDDFGSGSVSRNSTYPMGHRRVAGNPNPGPKGQFLSKWSFAIASTRKTSVNNDFYETLGDQWLNECAHPIALLRAENRLRNPWIHGVLESHCPGGRILDVGCGAGFLTNYLASRGFSAHGVDLSPSTLEIAQAQNITRTAEYKVGNADALPYPDSSFDAVAAMDLLEHVENAQAVIAEASRVLKPGGLFFFHTFNRTPLSYLLIIKGVEWCVRNTPERLHVYPLFIKPKEMRQFCEKNGLQVETMIGIRPEFRTKSMVKMLATRKVSPDFTFKFTSSLATGYSGFARKLNH